MPIYEYSCKKCGKTIELIQKFSDPDPKKHQGCGGALTKLVSAAGFQFKGTGWYVTDYARKGKDGEPKGDGASKPAETKSESKKSDSSSKGGGDKTPASSTAST